jgi:hypothetical protein
MQIQVNSDKNVDGREELVRQVEADVDGALSRFGDHLTRVEVHLGDESAGRSSGADMRCTMEARLDEACRGAVQKLQKLLASKFGRLDDRKRGDTIRRGEPS